MYKVAPQT